MKTEAQKDIFLRSRVKICIFRYNRSILPLLYGLSILLFIIYMTNYIPASSIGILQSVTADKKVRPTLQHIFNPESNIWASTDTFRLVEFTQLKQAELRFPDYKTFFKNMDTTSERYISTTL